MMAGYVWAIVLFNVTGSRLTAKPDFIRFGRIYKEICHGPMVAWLLENVPSYEKVIRDLESRWGKQSVIRKSIRRWSPRHLRTSEKSIKLKLRI